MKLTTSCPLCSVRPKLVNCISMHMLLFYYNALYLLLHFLYFVYVLILFACLYIISVLKKIIITISTTRRQSSAAFLLHCMDAKVHRLWRVITTRRYTNPRLPYLTVPHRLWILTSVDHGHGSSSNWWCAWCYSNFTMTTKKRPKIKALQPTNSPHWSRKIAVVAFSLHF